MNYQDFFAKYSYDRRADLVAKTRFGSIYKATATRRDQEVFLRIMPVKDGEATLMSEVEFVNALPADKAIVRYTKAYTFQESTGEVDCAIMEYFPLGNLIKLLEDWKLSDAERRGLRDRIIEAASFLRDNGVNLPLFDPSTVYVTEENGELYPHLTDLSGSVSDNTDYENEVRRFLPVADTPEEPETYETSSSEQPEETPAQEVEETAEEAEAETDEEQEELEEHGHSKALLLTGVLFTWIAIFLLIFFLHQRRNAAEAEEPKPDTTMKVIYPADEFVLEQKAHDDSVARAKADSIESARLDSALAAKALIKEAARKKEAEKKPEEPRREEAAPEISPAENAPKEPAHEPAHTPAPEPTPAPGE